MQMKQESGAAHALRFLAEAGCLAALGVLLLWFPKAVSAGATQGLRLCFSSLIGSLLPFLVLSRLAFLRGLLQGTGRGAVFTRRVLRLPGRCAGTVWFSLLGGYPVGPSLVALLRANGAVTPRQAKRMLLFCFGPGPAFVLSAVGAGMLGSKAAGAVLYVSVVLGALICGAATGLLQKSESPAPQKTPPPAPLPFAEALFRAVGESVESLVFICGCVALFSALLELLRAVSLPPPLLRGAAVLLEVTNACGALAGNASLPALAAAIGWGGLCTHCQVAPSLAAGGLSFPGFVCARALHAALSWLCCRGLLLVVRLPAHTLAQAPMLRPSAESNGLLSVCMLCMCALLLCGSGFTLRLKATKPLAISDTLCYNSTEDNRKRGPGHEAKADSSQRLPRLLRALRIRQHR